MLDYEMIRSKRKTVSIQITRDARVVVRAPLKMPQKQIAAFVSSHESWVEKHLKNAGLTLSRQQSFSFADGQSVYFKGECVVIRESDSIKTVRILSGEIQIPLNPDALAREKAVTVFFRKQASMLLPERADFFAPRIGVTPQAITITGAKTRWGSCSGKNRISFSYRLVCMPLPLIDYVVVHELAHILEHNHSPRFYAQIEQVLPDYRQLQKELRAFGRKLPY